MFGDFPAQAARFWVGLGRVFFFYLFFFKRMEVVVMVGCPQRDACCVPVCLPKESSGATLREAIGLLVGEKGKGCSCALLLGIKCW